jgi:hypothetical protein
MRIVFALAGATLLASAPAFADDLTAKPKQNDGEKVICHSEQIVGSHLSERVCRTKSEWDAARSNDKNMLDRRNGQLIVPKPKGSG